MSVVVPLKQRRPEPTDGELVVAVRGGDLPAQHALYRRHARMALGLAHRLLGRCPDVDDVVQDAFVAAFEGLDRLEDPSCFAKWLGSIVVRTARHKIKRWQLLRRLGIDSAGPEQFERMVSTQVAPDVAAELGALYGVLDGLPEEQRVALVLRRVEGMSLPEIAEAMSLSLATVKRRLFKAEAALAKQIGVRPRGEER